MRIYLWTSLVICGTGAFFRLIDLAGDAFPKMQTRREYAIATLVAIGWAAWAAFLLFVR